MNYKQPKLSGCDSTDKQQMFNTAANLGSVGTNGNDGFLPIQEDASGPVPNQEGQVDEVERLRTEIKELQDTVASANKDLHLAEVHANEMEERCVTLKGFHLLKLPKLSTGPWE
jgi:hypothetical protein